VRSGAEGKKIVSARSSNIPNYSERTLLQAIRRETRMPPLKKTIAKLLAKGWIERHPEVTDTQKYRVTQAGQSALRIKITLSR
jgi:DNA-binding MarR family transcriptional regulator